MSEDKLAKVYKSFHAQYVETKTFDLKMKVLKQIIKEKYTQQKETSLKVLEKNNLVIRETRRKKYEAKPEIYEYLEDHSVLPLVVKINKSLEKHFNLEKAKINFRDSIRVYPGRKKIIDKFKLENDYLKAYEKFQLEDLTKEFNTHYSIFKLSEKKLEEKKTELIEVMQNENLWSFKSPDMGTIKYEQNYDYDPFSIFDAVSGKKELYLKESGSSFEIILFPENKKAILPKNFVFNGMELQEYTKQSKIEKPILIKKSEFNTLTKEGFVGYAFEVPVDPNEFFRELEVSRTKIQGLVDKGILKEKEVEQFFTVEEQDEEDDPDIQILPEGVAEQQRDMFFERLLERSQNLRELSNTSVNSIQDTNHSLVDVGFEDFSF